MRVAQDCEIGAASRRNRAGNGPLGNGVRRDTWRGGKMESAWDYRACDGLRERSQTLGALQGLSSGSPLASHGAKHF